MLTTQQLSKLQTSLDNQTQPRYANKVAHPKTFHSKGQLWNEVDYAVAEMRRQEAKLFTATVRIIQAELNKLYQTPEIDDVERKERFLALIALALQAMHGRASLQQIDSLVSQFNVEFSNSAEVFPMVTTNYS